MARYSSRVEVYPPYVSGNQQGKSGPYYRATPMLTAFDCLTSESGTGNDLVILLHGFPEFWYSWRHQLAVLGKNHHVVAPDMRGWFSEKPGGGVETTGSTFW